MTISIDENVLRLQIPICDAFLVVQELQNQADLSGIEACGLFLEGFVLP